MKSCKSLETFLSPENLTYCFAVETCLGEWWVTEKSSWVGLVLFTRSDQETGLTGWKKLGGVIEQKEESCQRLFTLSVTSEQHWTGGGHLLGGGSRSKCAGAELCHWCGQWRIRPVLDHVAQPLYYTSGNAFYYECNVTHETESTYCFTTWTQGWLYTSVHASTCAHIHVSRSQTHKHPFFHGICCLCCSSWV